MELETPIDLTHLNAVCNNDPYDREFLISIYLRETRKELQRLRDAVDAGLMHDVHRMANGCAASSESYGMVAVTPPLRELERAARSGDLSNAPAYLEQFQNEIERIETFSLTLTTFEEQAKAA